MASHRIWIKKEARILYGLGKTIEVRLKHGRFAEVVTGDELDFGEGLVRVVGEVRVYPSFEALVRKESVERIHPRLRRKAALLELLSRLYPNAQGEGFEVVAFHLLEKS